MRRAVLVSVMLIGCKATTGRPGFVPFPEAEHTEIGFNLADEDESVFMVTDTIAARLQADSIPVNRVIRVDGYLETPWFDAKTLQPTTRRPLGPDVVRVRAWVDPSKPGFARVEIETVYVPRADPSVPDRELEAPVPAVHPVNIRVGEMLRKLAEKYGVPPDQQEPKPADRGPGQRRPPVADTGARVPAAVPAPPPPPPLPPP